MSEEKTGYAVREILFKNNQDAEKVLTDLRNEVSEFGFVAVADLYYHRLTPDRIHRPKAWGWGWTDLRDARIDRKDGCSYIFLPKPIRDPRSQGLHVL